MNIDQLLNPGKFTIPESLKALPSRRHSLDIGKERKLHEAAMLKQYHMTRDAQKRRERRLQQITDERNALIERGCERISEVEAINRIAAKAADMGGTKQMSRKIGAGKDVVDKILDRRRPPTKEVCELAGITISGVSSHAKQERRYWLCDK